MAQPLARRLAVSSLKQGATAGNMARGDRMAAVLDSLSAITSHGLFTRPGCGGQVRTLYCAYCGAEIRVPVGCGDRTCPDCRKLDFLRLRKRYLPLVQSVEMPKLALVTLTMRLSDADENTLADKVNAIRAAWSKLVRLRRWQKCVSGGLVVIEAKWSSRFLGVWNVHIHALVEARLFVNRFRYRDKWGRRRLGGELIGKGAKLTPQQLSAEWLRLTGGSFIVDISPVRKLKHNTGGARGALCYVLKYMLKGLGFPSDAARWAYNTMLRKRRLVQTFGAWHPTSKEFSLRLVKGQRQVPPCKTCGQAAGWLTDWQLFGLSQRAQAPAPDLPAPVSAWPQAPPLPDLWAADWA